jgi:hypothetical protein
MNITFKHYAKRDGSVMLYINRSNGISVGISEDKGFRPYGKGLTEGQRNAMIAARAVMKDAPLFTGDLKAHAEGGLAAVTHLCDGWTLVGTDVGNIGGMTVGSDGGYVIYDGRITKCGVAHDEPRETVEIDAED